MLKQILTYAQHRHYIYYKQQVISQDLHLCKYHRLLPASRWCMKYHICTWIILQKWRKVEYI